MHPLHGYRDYGKTTNPSISNFNLFPYQFGKPVKILDNKKGREAPFFVNNLNSR
jgi:hypothetical protein